MTMIDPEPSDWRDLEEKVARILRECGMGVRSRHRVVLARGEVEIDVFALDSTAVPPITTVCECKYWHTPVPQNVVHGFRSVVADCGANVGLIISAAGFQAGARTAAQFTNVQLLTWEEFQQLFAVRWFDQHMLPALAQAVGPLVEYTEPFNSRITQESRALAEERQGRFVALREKWGAVAFLLPLWTFCEGGETRTLPDLPLRGSLAIRPGACIPAAVLDATTLRELMESLLISYRQAIGDFDGVFDGRG